MLQRMGNGFVDFVARDQKSLARNLAHPRLLGARVMNVFAALRSTYLLTTP